MTDTAHAQDCYPVSGDWATDARVDAAAYDRLYAAAARDPDTFWLDQAKRLDWTSPPTVAGDWSFDADDFRINWFADGTLNVAANCLDRHLADRGDTIAIIWEPDDPAAESRRFTYRELHAEVCRFANVLRAQGVAKGDRVTIYLPMIPEASSTLALRGMRFPPRRPSSAVMTRVEPQSSIRPAIASGEKPPNTTEWIAP
ncbi:MAG: AMP-binding protein, partial [Pseudomonadota bacterium]|nr:AMP-binding protein [Pseudomonadota bacterium]